VARANPHHSEESVYVWFNVLPECNPGSHRPAPHLCAVEGECHGGAVCHPARHMDASSPGMRAYLPDVWRRTFGHSLPPLPPSAAQQVVWSTRLVMHTRWALRMARALRLLSAVMLADMEVLAAQGTGGSAARSSTPRPGGGGQLQCPFSMHPRFGERDFSLVDANPPRCVAMLLERAVNHWLVGAGMRTVMVLPRTEFGEWGPPYEVASPADLQPVMPEAWGKRVAPYLLAL